MAYEFTILRVYGKACVAYLSNYSFDFCLVFSLPLPSICSYEKSGGPAMSALESLKHD